MAAQAEKFPVPLVDPGVALLGKVIPRTDQA